MSAYSNQRFNLWQSSIQFLKKDPQLAVFPLASGIASLFVTGAFALPLWQSGVLERWGDDDLFEKEPWLIGVFILFGIASQFVACFFNAALVACAILRIRGESATLADGFNVACYRIPKLLGWVLFNAFVGSILRGLSSRGGAGTKIFGKLAEGAWNVSTCLAVPVIVVEDVGPITAVQRSFALFRKSWGETLANRMGLGLVVAGLWLLAAVPAGVGFFAFEGEWFFVGLGMSLTLGLVLMVVVSALRSVLTALLYLHAVDATDKALTGEFTSAVPNNPEAFMDFYNSPTVRVPGSHAEQV